MWKRKSRTRLFQKPVHWTTERDSREPSLFVAEQIARLVIEDERILSGFNVERLELL